MIALDDGDELSVHLSAIDGEAEVDAIAAARSALAQLKDLDARATGYLFDLPNWPHGDDARLWLLIVQHDNVRLCYSQVGVNDEQAIGFTLANGEWVLQGHDPRHRGDAPNPFDQKVNVPPAAASRSRPGSLR